MITPQQFNRFAADPAAFRDALTVDVDGVARRFGAVQDPWQRADFASLDPALMKCNGRSQAGAPSPQKDDAATDKPARMRAYLERPRGHSKTTDLAVTCCWALAFATRPIRGYAFAADKDQAGLLKDAMATIVRLNPWLGSILDVQKNLVLNHAKGHPGAGSELTISTSDVASSYGILPDLIIADELTHWEGDGSLWHSLISSAAKRSTCLLVVISNAGFVDSWQWNVREAARTDDAWVFSRLDGPQASWMTEERLAEQRRMLPAIAYARLWENLWSSGGGDALTPEDIAAAFKDDLEPMTGKEPGWLFVAGLDLGLTRDCSAVVVLGIPASGKGGKIRLAHNKLWRPVPGRKLNIGVIEDHLLKLEQQYSLQFCAFDPWQAEHLAQRLEMLTERRRRKSKVFTPFRPKGTFAWMQEVAPTARNLREQAGLVIESFSDRRMLLYECDPLRSDLHKLRVEEKSYGLRLVSPRDGEGHGDTFSAFALALVMAHELAGKARVKVGVMKDGVGGGAAEVAMRRVEARAERFRREQEDFARGDDNSLAAASQIFVVSRPLSNRPT